MTNKEKYRLFCEKEEEIAIFSQAWYLDAVCGTNNWNIAIVEKGGHIVATMPYFLKQKAFFFKISTSPKLTQKLGPYIKYPNNQKNETKLAYEKEVISSLIAQLPKVDYFLQRFNYDITNILPFHWSGFKQSITYTYVLEDLTNLDRIFANFASNIKTDIRKAEKKLTVISNEDLELFYKINSMTFDRQKIAIPYSAEYLKTIDEACKTASSRKIFFAVDNDQQIHAAIYIIWDKNSAYYLLGGADPEKRNSGATSLLMWEAIKFASSVTKKFDFEGSMMEPIERFVRAFGSTQKILIQVEKADSKIIKIANFLKSF